MAVPQVMTPREIVSELDRYIVGQHDAKRAVAIALRNRWRRQNVAPELRDEIAPKNILMIGPTGVGKTEIARRLARLAQAPFVKVEASRYTEVGYVGRDVESMIRDLAEIAVKMVRDEARDRVAVKARENAEERLLDLLFPAPTKVRRPAGITPEGTSEAVDNDSHKDTREKLRKLLNGGHLDDREVELEVSANAVPNIEVFTPQGMEEMGLNMKELMNQLMPKKTRTRKVKIPEALELLTHGGSGAAGRYGGGRARGDLARGAVGHRVHRRDRQNRRARVARPRRLARGRAARPAADRRRLDRQHQIRRGARPTTFCSSRRARFTPPSRRT